MKIWILQDGTIKTIYSDDKKNINTYKTPENDENRMQYFSEICSMIRHFENGDVEKARKYITMIADKMEKDGYSKRQVQIFRKYSKSKEDRKGPFAVMDFILS